MFACTSQVYFRTNSSLPSGRFVSHQLSVRKLKQQSLLGTRSDSQEIHGYRSLNKPLIAADIFAKFPIPENVRGMFDRDFEDRVQQQTMFRN